jgi:amino acid transporter
LKRLLLGKPRDLADRSIFHRLSLVPILAWIGLGADGLSSSSYGPEEAFRALGDQTYLALLLALATTITVFVISAAYSRIIEEFPQGGGGYVVATKLLGAPIGVVSGCALLVDYILTITTSLASAGDALFSLLPPGWQEWKLPFEVLLIASLTTLNSRGVRESVLAMAPIFLLFIITHIILIFGCFVAFGEELPGVVDSVGQGFQGGLAALGMGGMGMLFIHAYSMGGGTYTGLEAVSNGLQIMREPQVQTGKRTMMYMAVSLSFTASGLILCYLLAGVTPEPHKIMNAVLAERFAGDTALGSIFVILALVAEGALLIVGAQAGFIGGPRVLANMAVDSWMPRRFAALSDRLTTQNGVILMGVASLVALLYTGGVVHQLVVMYSINVFLTFSLSMFAMLRFWMRARRERRPKWKGRLLLFAFGLVLCATILVITVQQKFTEGGWVTLCVTGAFIVVCFLIRRHYRTVGRYLAKLDQVLDELPGGSGTEVPEPDPAKMTAAVLVGSYGGPGIHTLLTIFRTFPGYYKNLVFVGVGVIDSGRFKGAEEVAALREATEQTLQKYVDLAKRLGFPATYRLAVGIEVESEAEKLCAQVAQEFARATFFAGQVIFHRERWYDRFLHNGTAFTVQKKLQWLGLTMVILPVRVK